MKSLYHPAHSRGNANHGWLQSFHSFSFANYYNPERMHFGALRVLNDDTVAKGAGFGKHPHQNMEIITIPLEGKLHHGDDMGNSGIIEKGDIQVMSAGTGIVHSEKNASNTDSVKFLQIWIIPNQQNVEPRYGQARVIDFLKPNQLNPIVSPNKHEQGVWIHQNAWFYWGTFDNDINFNYTLNHAENGLYVFVVSGAFEIQEQLLQQRDGLGIWEVPEISIRSKSAKSEILLIEVPML